MRGNLSTSAGFDRRLRPASSFGLHTGKQVFGAQADNIKAGPIAVAVANGEIDILAREVDMMQGGGHAQVDARMLFGKAAEAVDQPFGCEVRRRADVKTPELCRWSTRSVPIAMRSKASRRTMRYSRPGVRDDQALTLAIEEFDPELRFQAL